MAINPTVWYVRDNSTLHTETGMTSEAIPGSVGWSALTAWAASTVIAAGAIRRQTAGSFVGTGSRSGTTVTISAVTSGSIYLGMQLFTAAGTALGSVSAFGTGTGGTGTYTVTGSGTVSAGTTINGGFVQNNQLAFIATVGGTTAATEPDWSKSGISKGAKITDNTVTWVECTGQPGVNGDFTNTPSWVASTGVLVGSIVKDAAGTHLFICTTSGTTKSGAEPTWVTTSVGSTTTDNTATWTYIGTSFGAWAAPLATATQSSSWIATGSTIYVGDDHVEIANVFSLSLLSANATPATLLSIDHTSNTRPPASADLKAGATFQSNTTNQINANAAYYYGCTFDAGVGASSSVFCEPNASAWQKFDTCTFKISSSSGSARVDLGISANGLLEFTNCTCVFANTSQAIVIACGYTVWRGGAIITGGSTPTTLFDAANTNQGSALFEGVDLSAISGTLVPVGTINTFDNLLFADCKLNGSATLAGTPAARGAKVDFVRCASDSKTYIQRRYWYQGTLQEEATLIRTGGASDGTTGISWKLTTTANATWANPLESFPVVIWNATTGSNVVVTLAGVWNSASLPNNDDIWVDVEYLGDTTPTPLGKYKLGSKTNILASASAQAADSVSAWDSLATARQNSHAYSLGDVYKSANNSGRIFFCTTAGTSASSEPAGVATAVDGGSVTDGTAVFRAGMRFTLTVTLTSPTPQLAGYIQAIVRAAKVSSTFYVDPLIVLS